MDTSRQKRKKEPHNHGMNVKLITLIPKISETTNVRTEPSAELNIPMSNENKYRPITICCLLTGRVPYNLLRLFFSATAKRLPIENADIMRTIPIITGGFDEIMPASAAIPTADSKIPGESVFRM
jgi:hypothetical protein